MPACAAIAFTRVDASRNRPLEPTLPDLVARLQQIKAE
jgi:hypothetical protein